MKRPRLLLGLGIVVLTAITLFLGYWLCFAFWMTAYYTDALRLEAWQTRFYVILAGLGLAGGLDLFFVVMWVRERRKR